MNKNGNTSLSDIYERMLLGEAKVDDKKGTVDGAVPVGKPVTGETPKVKGDGPNNVKGVEKPTEDTKNSDTKGHKQETVKTVKTEAKVTKPAEDNLFDKLYASVLSEAEDPLDQIPEVNDEVGGEDLPPEDLDAEVGGEDDLVSRLKAIRDELDATIMDLEGGEEDEAGEEGVEAPEAASDEFPVAQESVEAGGKPVELKAKGEELKKGQDVKGSKIKAKGDKASVPAGKDGNPRPSELGKKTVPGWKNIAKGPMGQTSGDFIQ